MKIFIISFLLVTGSMTASVAASVAVHKIAIYGVLKSYDKTNAVIELETGSKMTVPKAALATPVDGLITGKAKVIATLTVEELTQLNPKLEAEISKK
ncbi:MAG: hypothetical protein JNL11_05535 [Bdellovibrionaceae bacterium]|nr:hypothetical protein [Pseudobdellovibrionaceae bacterium]